MGLSYHERKRRGQQKRAEYLHRVSNAEHLATMLRGVTLGTSFMFVMFAVAGIDTTLDLLIWIGVFVIGCVSAVEAEHILFLAEQSRYPKSRRRTLRSELADEWHELRLRFTKS
jgi:hypothetical protein